MPSFASSSAALDCDEHHFPVRDDGAVVAFAFEVGDAQRHDVLAIGDLALRVVEHLALQHEHRVVIANGALEQALGVCRGARRDDLESGDVHEPGLPRLGVLCRQLQRRAVGSAEHERHRELPTRHVQHLRRRVDHLVEREHARSSTS